MKANELMIGDWVNFLIEVEGGNTEHDPQTAVYEQSKVRQIRTWGLDAEVECDDIINDIEQLQPILLTAEILLKNGFKQRKQDGEVQYILTADYYDVYVNEYPDGWWLVEYEDSERGDLPTERIAVRNVHQLQDAFRLFGVEKEIEL